MRNEPTCPRCGGEVRPPGLWSSGWQCARHGEVAPYHVMTHSGPDALSHVVTQSKVPVWLPEAMAGGWLCSGVGYAGDERTGGRASVTCLSGPSPLGGAADLVIVAEEPGVGLGARHAGLSAPDPGEAFDLGPPEAKVLAAGHPTPVWGVPASDDRAAFAGEAKGLWLWLVVFPATAGVLAYDALSLTDGRDLTPAWLEFGTLSARLQERPAS